MVALLSGASPASAEESAPAVQSYSAAVSAQADARSASSNAGMGTVTSGSGIAGGPDDLDPLARLEPLAESDLSQLRGGQTIVTGKQTLTAISSGNVLNGNYSAGSVTVSDDAFSNFSGIGNLAINTGAQVNLQSAMNVTINVGN